MKFTRQSVSIVVNTEEFLRLLSLADTKSKDFVIDKEDLSTLHETIEMLLDSYTQPPFAHS